ncbi:MAG TPA: glycosyltransferase [Actinoplanes sp.]
MVDRVRVVETAVLQRADRPELTIVVPVYGVEGFLHQCLDSIRAGLGDQESSTVEIVAVDDASPDRCGAMLDDYAATHPGIRVVHLTANVGLGRARNAGLEHARGNYVWFVDSDDRLPPGSVSAVLERLRIHRPDVLLVDHLRVHESGALEVDASSHLLRGADGVFRLDDRPPLLRLQHTAWNKVVRRGFLDDLGLRFEAGWYEDVPFSHPLLIAAERIHVLDRVCYHYRQGRTGAITSTRSDRHFDAFRQYERLHAWVQERSPAPWLTAQLFALMVSHYLVVAGNDGRLHPRDRREFFRRAAEHYRRYQPDGGYPRPAGAAGVKHRLVRRNSYLAYAGLRAAYRIAGVLLPAEPAVTPAGPLPAVTPAGPLPAAAPAGPGTVRTSAPRELAHARAVPE